MRLAPLPLRSPPPSHRGEEGVGNRFPIRVLPGIPGTRDIPRLCPFFRSSSLRWLFNSRDLSTIHLPHPLSSFTTLPADFARTNLICTEFPTAHLRSTDRMPISDIENAPLNQGRTAHNLDNRRLDPPKSARSKHDYPLNPLDPLAPIACPSAFNYNSQFNNR